MNKRKNVFISHYGKDDKDLQRLKQRLQAKGYNVYNYSVDSTNYKDRPKPPSDAVIRRLLRMRIKLSGTVICLIKEDTHTRSWVNYEIEQAHKAGKPIVGIYGHGCKDKVNIPSSLVLYQTHSTLSWYDLEGLGEVMENPEETLLANVLGSLAGTGTQETTDEEVPVQDCPKPEIDDEPQNKKSYPNQYGQHEKPGIKCVKK